MSTSIERIGSAALPEVAEPNTSINPNNGRFGPKNPPPKRYFDATPCEGPDCKKIVSAGLYSPLRIRSFCSNTCRNREAASRYLVGTCAHCNGPIMGRKDEAGIKRYCSDEHWRAYETDQILGPAGVFRPLIEEYMAAGAANYYAPGTLPTVRVSLATFFRFVVQVEKIVSLDDIRSRVITRFIAMQRERGMTSRNFVGHLATFFRWLIHEERYYRANPVISRIHSQRGAPAAPRPYNDQDLLKIWECVEKSGKLELMLAFAIGEECGLRVGEVSNIRLSDIDQSAQTIYVRLPTKNKRTRTVPFHGKVKKHLELWLERRDSRCEHDHLLHNKASHRFTGIQLDEWFKKLLSKEPDPAHSFKFHRLRHTWATRLMNHGMELAVLKELGGWESWNSMQRYVMVLDSTVRAQYEASYARLQESATSGEDEVISLLDYALMSTRNDTTSTVSAR